MRIVHDWPPNIDEIDAAFGARKVKAIMFCYGDAIYRPCGTPVSPDLIAHETMHSERQAEHPGGIVGWWREYIADPKFRLAEEILAHRAEFRYLRERWPNPANVRENLSFVALRLCSPLYGKLLTLSEAKKAISA